jgi:hypothetical protein
MGFIRFRNTGFSAAWVRPAGEWRVEALYGTGQIAQVSAAGLAYSGPVGAGGGTEKLSDIPEPYKSAAEGVLMLPIVNGSWQTLLFKGDRVCWYHWDRKVISEGPVADLAQGGPTWGSKLPEWYLYDVDALLMDAVAETAAWKTYVFKGDRVASLDWATGTVREALIREGAEPTAGWGRLDAYWQCELDHVLPLPSVAGAKRSLLVKGTRGCVFNWNTGPEQTGPMSGLAPGLNALPAACLTPFRPVSGRYAAQTTSNAFTVRVDVDRDRPMVVLSGDVWSVSGGTRSFSASFRIDWPTIEASASQIVVSGTPEWKPGLNVNNVRVVIPRVAAGAAPPPATLTLQFPGGGTNRYTLNLESDFFRTVDLETDAMAERPAFISYDTSRAQVPAGYANRVLSVASAYAEAGLEVRAAGTVNVVAATDSGADLRWSDSELHTALTANFSQYADSPQWKLWAFVANRHVDATTLGIMFDRTGKHRQGMAVFYDAMRDNGQIGTRSELLCYVHEIGHAFNLVHSWDKAAVGAQGGPSDLSWMNYDWKFPGGAQEFWRRFPFGFTADEVMHLRHAHYTAIVPGGADWALYGSAALTADDAALAALAEPVTDESGLALTLSARPHLYGEPVTVEVKLALAADRPVRVHDNLSPKGEHITFAITSPAGTVRIFRPLARVCSGHGQETLISLDADHPAVYASAYLGSGADGQYFTDPGLYTVRAVYTAPDGSRVVSPGLRLRVRLPLTGDDQDAGELLMSDQSGTLMALLGSDSPALEAGNAELAELSARFGDHPLGVYSRLAHGANNGRDYQHIANGRIAVRRPDTKTSIAQLTASIDASTGPSGLNNITLNAAMRRLATVQAKAGDLDRAEATLNRLVEYFQHQNVPPAVLETITEQADATRNQIMESP